MWMRTSICPGRGLDLLWANRDVRVLLTRRLDDWVRSRLTKFGPDTNAPMDCLGLRLGSFTRVGRRDSSISTPS